MLAARRHLGFRALTTTSSHLACSRILASAPRAASATTQWPHTDSRIARLRASLVGASLDACPAPNPLRTHLEHVRASLRQPHLLVTTKLRSKQQVLAQRTTRPPSQTLRTWGRSRMLAARRHLGFRALTTTSSHLACSRILASAPRAASATTQWPRTDSRIARLRASLVGASLVACPALSPLRTHLEHVRASRQQPHLPAKIKLSDRFGPIKFEFAFFIMFFFIFLSRSRLHEA